MVVSTVLKTAAAEAAAEAVVVATARDAAAAAAVSGSSEWQQRQQRQQCHQRQQSAAEQAAASSCINRRGMIFLVHAGRRFDGLGLYTMAFAAKPPSSQHVTNVESHCRIFPQRDSFLVL